MGLLISYKTLNIDNPKLNCRLSSLSNFSPKRIILDNKLRTKTSSYIFKTSNKINTIFFYSNADKEKILSQLQTKQIQLNNLQKTDPNQEALVNAFFNSKPGQKYLQNTMSSLLNDDRKSGDPKYKGEDDRQLLIDAIENLREFINTELITGVGSRSQVKDGGRIGLQDGTPPVTEIQGGGQDMSQNNNPISFDQLRARLPQEITDDIVTLMSNSAEALNDFASISTQQDVNNFNKKFNVNLVLPAEA